MKYEIECRLLNCNVEELLKKLRQLDAKFIGDWLQVRNCYDFTPVRPNSWIRLRTNGQTTTLTIKEVNSTQIDGTKECEIIVSDFQTTDELLNKLGYTARSRQENRRIQFVLDNVEIDIDFWPFIPPFVEFEAENQKQIESVCKKLGIDFCDTTSIDVEKIYNLYGYDFAKFPEIILLEKDKKNKIFIK